jgi:hypothetical protein
MPCRLGVSAEAVTLFQVIIRVMASTSTPLRQYLSGPKRKYPCDSPGGYLKWAL